MRHMGALTTEFTEARVPIAATPRQIAVRVAGIWAVVNMVGGRVGEEFRMSSIIRPELREVSRLESSLADSTARSTGGLLLELDVSKSP